MADSPRASGSTVSFRTTCPGVGGEIDDVGGIVLGGEGLYGVGLFGAFGVAFEADERKLGLRRRTDLRDPDAVRGMSIRMAFGRSVHRRFGRRNGRSPQIGLLPGDRPDVDDVPARAPPSLGAMRRKTLLRAFRWCRHRVPSQQNRLPGSCSSEGQSALFTSRSAASFVRQFLIACTTPIAYVEGQGGTSAP